MSAVYGLQGLIEKIGHCIEAGRSAQVAGLSQSLAQLTALGLLERSLEASKREHANVGPAAALKLIVVLPSMKEVQIWSRFLEYLPGWKDRITAGILPPWTGWAADRFVNQSRIRHQRLYALGILRSSEASLVLTTLEGLGQTTLSPATFENSSFPLKAGEEYDQDELAGRLVDLGYNLASTVEEPGQYTLRGAILDVFCPSSLRPFRIEFLGDTITSIRSFDPVKQRSLTDFKTIDIRPATEVLTRAAARKQQAQALFDALLTQSIESTDRDGMLAAFQASGRFQGLDMFGPVLNEEGAKGLDFALDFATNESISKPIVIFPKPIETCFESYATFFDQVARDYQEDLVRKRPAIDPNKHFPPVDKLKQAIHESTDIVEFGNPYTRPGVELIRMAAQLAPAAVPMSGEPGLALFDKWIDLFESMRRQASCTIVILCHQEEQVERVINLLEHRRITAFKNFEVLSKLVAGSIGNSESVVVGLGDLASHIWLEDEATLVVPEQSIFGSSSKKRRPASAKLQTYLSSFKDLKTGNLVVHVEHGIGRYLGLTSLQLGSTNGDFLILEFAGGDKIYLPVDRLNLLQRYNEGGEEAPRQTLDRLGGPQWDNRKSRVRKAIRDMAEELLKTQAKRSVISHHTYSPPDETFLRFEAAFPFEETEDQLRAIEEVEDDLMTGKAMDRLICGDVGFGKTEVALRAAMRVVLEGFQVLVLVPTTVLCYQHYRTFSNRLESFGAKVAQVNRFVKGTNIRESLAGLASGQVDVLVGTHRILSKDIKPKRLGLLVIDEEQRFGVAHKEKLKALKVGCDILTLSATPIPRTLHMAMVGLRDISIIATPPHDRLSIRTFIANFDEVLIADAIRQEVRRGGQVFFIHNRVQDIEEMRTLVKSLVPEIEIRTAHGQMKEQQLEKVIVEFMDQRFPVLLCTTIVESGIDMPNVNTLIVNRADQFGLSQLYQLRGRVGRSNVQAYAYFLTPPVERLTEDAIKRLDVLAAHQELGAGFQIASHDLELRGAGNLLGGEQSGHATAVGLELYTDMLEQAIAELQGAPIETKVDTEIQLPIEAVIPVSYVEAENERLQLYKALFATATLSELNKFKQDVSDRYGTPPADMEQLYKIGRLKQLLRHLQVKKIKSGGEAVCDLTFASLTEQRISQLTNFVKGHGSRYQLMPDYRLRIFLDLSKDPNSKDGLLTGIIARLDPLVDWLSES